MVTVHIPLPSIFFILRIVIVLPIKAQNKPCEKINKGILFNCFTPRFD